MTFKLLEQTVRNLVFKCFRFSSRDFSVTGVGGNNMCVELRKTSSVVRSSTRFPFQGYALSGGLVVGVRAGTVRLEVPSNITIEIEVPADSTDGYWVWVKSERTGDHFSDGVTNTIEHGATLPTPPLSSGGLPPAWTFQPLFYVVTGSTSIISIEQIVYTNMWINENPIQSCMETVYDLEWVYGNTIVGP